LVEIVWPIWLSAVVIDTLPRACPADTGSEVPGAGASAGSTAPGDEEVDADAASDVDASLLSTSVGRDG
jgi:hypothetical protein